MRRLLVGIALATGLTGSAAQSADVTRVTRVQTEWAQPGRAISRLADQGLGYSVLHDAPSGPQGFYRVHVTCAIDETFMQTYCPTPAYASYCPRARIVCADGGQSVQALRLRY
ncbi:hypothetical protein [Microvirga sp. VF16]|uniref:hypothetical protein n=1 Tax=Microvirga sp. VF16 TaxID=2807101 RepID=UPI00193DCE69|nr:hypothetical protein [Microvirga sp. VF16]QRM29354.1 hypothetical protein JO965_24855 [Microvirga sp. VF16]